MLRPLFVTKLPSSLQFMQPFTASSYTQQKQQQPPPAPRPLFIAETGPFLYQKVYSPLPEPGNSLPEEPPQAKCFVQQAAVPSNPGRHSPHPDAADFRRLIDQYPFVYSFTKDLPNIFGNLEDDDVSVEYIDKEMSSVPPLGERASSFYSEGWRFKFGRQD